LIIKILLLLTTIFLVIGTFKRADIYIVLLKGFMVGALYHKEQYDDGFDEYTLQCMLGILSFTVRWEREQSG